MGSVQADEPSTPARDARRDLALAWTVGFATGVYSTGLIMGSVAGVYLTKPLADVLGSWRWALVIWAALGVCVVGAWTLWVSPAHPSPRQSETGFRTLLRRRELWVLAFLFAAGNASYFFLVGNY